MSLRKNHGNESARARARARPVRRPLDPRPVYGLFSAFWIPDLFMKRIEQNRYFTHLPPLGKKARRCLIVSSDRTNHGRCGSNAWSGHVCMVALFPAAC